MLKIFCLETITANICEIILVISVASLRNTVYKKKIKIMLEILHFSSKLKSNMFLNGSCDIVIKSFIYHARSRPKFVAVSRDLVLNRKKSELPHLLKR